MLRGGLSEKCLEHKIANGENDETIEFGGSRFSDKQPNELHRAELFCFCSDKVS